MIYLLFILFYFYFIYAVILLPPPPPPLPFPSPQCFLARILPRVWKQSETTLDGEKGQANDKTGMLLLYCFRQFFFQISF